MKCEEISWVLLAKIPSRGWVRELCMCACHTNHSLGRIKQRIKLPVRKYDDIFLYLETCQITVCCSVKHVFGLLLFQFDQDRRPAWKLVKTDVASSLNTKRKLQRFLVLMRVGWPRIGKYAKVLRKYWGVNLGQRIKAASKSLYLTDNFITPRPLCQELAHLGFLHG